jgi:multiple sugar transport system permease protein
MKKSKRTARGEASTLTLRLWEFTGTALLNLFIFILLLVYLSPLSYTIVTSLKTRTQLQDGTSPLWPGELKTYNYQGKDVPIYKVPTADGVRELALVEPHLKYSMYIDPVHPEEGLIRWEGFYRSLHRVYSPKITFTNFTQLWRVVDYPHVVGNTLYVVLISGIGVLLSSIAVAYGFSRFRIPGGKYLFILVIATIMIPDSILLIPSFVIYNRVLGWNGSYLPLIVPPFFGSAVYIFLLRQNFKSIPRDLDEAAMLDGAGPLRILISIILPQSLPTVTTVALLHFFNMWNELRISSLYLGTRQDLQTIAFTATFTPTVGFTPELLQAGTLIFLVVPVIVLLLSQRMFMQDMVITGLEK